MANSLGIYIIYLIFDVYLADPWKFLMLLNKNCYVYQCINNEITDPVTD